MKTFRSSLFVLLFFATVRRDPAQPVDALYCFGFSWTDTQAAGWGPPQYYTGHASNGPIWPEFVSTNLALTYVPANNFARVGADSAGILAQVKQLKPNADPSRSLYVLWAGQSDFLYAASSLFYPTRTLSPVSWTNEVAWENIIQNTLKNNSNALEQLYAKGARSILVQNNFDLSTFPLIVDEYKTNPAGLQKLRERTTQFNALLQTAVDSMNTAHPDLRLFIVNIQDHLNELLQNASLYGFTKTYPSALDDAKLSDKTFSGPGSKYVFWDGAHGTSKTALLVAGWNLESLTNNVPERLVATASGTSLNIEMLKLRIARTYTLQQSADLKNWSDLSTFVADTGTNSLTGSIVGARQSYFRLRW
jgi:hypothetical protein